MKYGMFHDDTVEVESGLNGLTHVIRSGFVFKGNKTRALIQLLLQLISKEICLADVHINTHPSN